MDIATLKPGLEVWTFDVSSSEVYKVKVKHIHIKENLVQVGWDHSHISRSSKDMENTEYLDNVVLYPTLEEAKRGYHACKKDILKELIARTEKALIEYKDELAEHTYKLDFMC